VIARERNAAALYDADAMSAIVARVIPGAVPAWFPPAYGPQMALFFRPFASLSYFTALYVWFGLSLLAYAVCAYAIWRVCPRLHDRPWTTAVLLVAAPALHFALGFLHVSAIGLVCVTAAFFALRADRPLLAGLAIGSLAYKPPLGLAAAFVFIGAGEWRIVLGAIAAAAAQLAAGSLYWGPSMWIRYGEALRRYAEVPVEPFKFQMHSWRAFFELLRLQASIALLAYLIMALVTLAIAFRCWRARGPLALRYSVLLIATVLVDPHMYAYDLVLLMPAFLLLWDWILAQRDVAIGEIVPRVPFARVRRQSFNAAFTWLLYFCYFSPLFGIVAEVGRIQISVPALFLLGAIVASLSVPIAVRRRSRDLTFA
jgi:hypothetical protein